MCGAALALLAACGPAAVKGPTVIVYGDSLTVQSEGAALALHRTPKQNVVFRAEGGTAMCDWISQAAVDRRTLRPQRVVIAFTGNTASCAAATYLSEGDPGAIAEYEHSLRQMRAIFPTQSMTVVIPPAMHNVANGWFPFNGNPGLVAMYKRVGGELGMTIDTSADDDLTPGHVYERYRPAYPHGKLVAVRLSDGVHLTPAGALWYGYALLRPVPGPTTISKPSSPSTATPDLPGAVVPAPAPPAANRG